MRIAFVSHCVNKRLGVPRCVAELVERFSLSDDVTVFSDSVADLSTIRFRFVRIPSVPGSRLLGHASFWAVGAAVARLERHLRDQGFDIVHSTVGPVLFANVVTMHFCQAAEWSLIRRGAFRGPQNLSKLRSLDYNLYRRLTMAIERRTFSRRGPAAVTVVSEQMKKDVVTHYGEGAGNVFVIPNAVDAREFHPRNRDEYRLPVRRELGIPLRAPVILFVGGDWERKGLPQAIASLGLMRRNDPVLLVVGPGSAAQYRDLARRYGVESRVVFVGSRSHTAPYYAAADVLTLPSLYEPFGLVVTEAMASGLPVVVSPEVGASFLITNRGNGIVMEPAWDEGSLAEELEYLLECPESRKLMAENGRLTAERLSWDNVARQTLSVYQYVLGVRALESVRGWWQSDEVAESAKTPLPIGSALARATTPTYSPLLPLRGTDQRAKLEQGRR